MLYLLAMVRPVVPIIEYYANYDYIATVLCENRDKPYLECNGKCYLEKQLKQNNHNNHEHKSTIPQINFDDYPISPLTQFTYKLKSFSNYFRNNFILKSEHVIGFYESILKPPRYLS